MPKSLTKGLDKQGGDPAVRCMYSGMVDGKFKAVSIMHGPFPLAPGEDPTGGNGSDVKTETINGVTAYSFVKNGGKTVSVVFSTTGGTGNVDLEDDALSPTKLRTAAVAATKQVMDTLGVHGSDTGASEGGNGSATGGGKNGAWPSDVCELMPEELTSQLQKKKADPAVSCIYAGSYKGVQATFELRHENSPVDQHDPTGGEGTDLQKDEYGSTTVWSYLVDGGGAAIVRINTGPDSLSVRLTADVPAEALRSEAISLAVYIAGELED